MIRSASTCPAGIISRGLMLCIAEEPLKKSYRAGGAGKFTGVWQYPISVTHLLRVQLYDYCIAEYGSRFTIIEGVVAELNRFMKLIDLL